jgi:proteasome lid subunit RPN8/RPN11
MAKSSVIQLSKQHLRKMIQHANNEAEYEICGLIGGQWQAFDHLAVAVQIETVTNIADDRRHQYRMDEQEQVRLMSAFGKAGMELVGIYHSHPHGPAYPSPTDIAEATYPDAVYLILSPSKPLIVKNRRELLVREDGYQVGAWWIRRGRVTAVEILIVGEH